MQLCACILAATVVVTTRVLQAFSCSRFPDHMSLVPVKACCSCRVFVQPIMGRGSHKSSCKQALARLLAMLCRVSVTPILGRGSQESCCKQALARAIDNLHATCRWQREHRPLSNQVEVSDLLSGLCQQHRPQAGQLTVSQL